MFLGRFVTNIGDSLYFVAAMWLVFDLTNNPVYSGIASAVIMIPQSLQFLIGPLIDRWNLSKIMVNTQLIQSFLIFIIPLAYFLNILNVWLVIAVMFLAVTIEQFVYPAHYAAMPRLLEKKQFVSGNSLLTVSQQGSDFILTGLSGLLLIYFGAINIYLLDSLTFLLAAFLFKMIKFPKEKTIEKPKIISLNDSFTNYKNDFKEGISVIKNSLIPKILFPLLISNLLFGVLNAVLPAYSNYRGGELFYGYYLSSMAAGMLIGSLLASRVEKFSFGKLMMFNFTFMFSFWFAAGTVSNSYLSVVLFGITLIPLGISNVLIFSLFQTIIPQELLGRAETIISSITSLSLPIGAIFGGILANKIGVDVVFTSGALSGVFLLIYWALSKDLRSLPILNNMNDKKYFNAS